MVVPCAAALCLGDVRHWQLKRGSQSGRIREAWIVPKSTKPHLEAMVNTNTTACHTRMIGFSRVRTICSRTQNRAAAVVSFAPHYVLIA